MIKMDCVATQKKNNKRKKKDFTFEATKQFDYDKVCIA